jgi:uncharacterized membrane protein (UPF0182 family)
MSNRGRIAIIVFVVLIVALFLSARGIAGFYTDELWYDALGQTDVFWGVIGAKVALAAIFTVVFGSLLVLNLWIADRLAPKSRAPGPEEQFIERYQQIVGRRAWLFRITIGLLFGLVAGVPVASQWKDWLLFTHSVSFGQKDAEFGMDIGFYVFRLPFLTFIVDWLFAALVIIFIITAVAHYLNGGIRLQVQGRRVTPQVKLHLSVLLACLAILKAAGYWLQQYELTTSTRGVVDGATYTDVNAQLPAIKLLFLISLLAAVLLIINVWQRGWRLPVIAVGLWGLVAVVAGAVYPAFVQRFQVQPAESTKERPYIERNIAATRTAMGLNNVEVVPYQRDTLDPQELAPNTQTLENIRLIDTEAMAPTYQKLEALRGYYQLNQLDVDRYEINGREQQAVIGARELNPDGLPGNTWENRHLAYTHGYGAAFAPGSEMTTTGQPVFIDTTTQTNTAPFLQQPAIYFGENIADYAIVATKRPEISYSSSGQDAQVSYQGSGGVSMGSTLRRAAFALRFGEINIFTSGLITGQSRILYVRDVRARVQMLAPFLDYDSNPYPVIIDGRLKWVIDAYTTTNRYPYAQRADTDAVIAGSGLDHRFNYVRNSVKAVVDAYDGDVTFYIVDQSDPIAKAWSKAFPKLFTPGDQAPAELKAHFRYPEDLFRVQTTEWGRYHISDPGDFYQRSDAWNVAQNPPKEQENRATTPVAASPGVAAPLASTKESRIPPYYTLMVQPGTSNTEFVSVRSFVPFSDNDSLKTLTAFMTASSDPSDYGKLRVYAMSTPLPDGPALADSTMKSNFAQALTLLDQSGSRVTFGDQQLIPIGNSLMYVRAWYVQATGQTPVPQVNSVTISYEQSAYRGSTLEDALQKAFGVNLDLGTVVGGAIAPLPDVGNAPGPGGGATTTPTTAPGEASPSTTAPSNASTTAPPGGATNDPEALLAQAQAAYNAAQAALKQNPPDIGTYTNKLNDAYRLASQAASIATGQSVTAVPPSTAPPGASVSPGSSPSTTANA